MIEMQIVDKAGLQLIQRLTKMDKVEGKAELEGLEKFTEGEIEQLTTLCKKQMMRAAPNLSPRERTNEYYAERRKVMAALWLLGASWRQLGIKYNIAKQTAAQGAQRELADGGTRIVEVCSFSRMAEYEACFWENKEELAQQDPASIARWLLGNTEMDE